MSTVGVNLIEIAELAPRCKIHGSFVHGSIETAVIFAEPAKKGKDYPLQSLFQKKPSFKVARFGGVFEINKPYLWRMCRNAHPGMMQFQPKQTTQKEPSCRICF